MREGMNCFPPYRLCDCELFRRMGPRQAWRKSNSQYSCYHRHLLLVRHAGCWQRGHSSLRHF